MSGLLWAKIPGFSNYLVNEMGEIRGPSGKILKVYQPKSQACRISLRNDQGFQHTQNVNRLILAAFTEGGDKPDHHVIHKDGNEHNFALANLDWLPKSDYSKHKGHVEIWHKFTCPICGKHRTIRAYDARARLRVSDKIFCSKMCAGTARSKRREYERQG